MVFFFLSCVVLVGLIFLVFKLFAFLHIPTPALLASLFVCGFMNIQGWLPVLPEKEITIAGQVLLGVFVAAYFEWKEGESFVKYIFPVLFTLVGIFSLSMFSGFALTWLTGLDLPTSLIASSAGGLTEMIALGLSLHANVLVISVIQLARMVALLVVIPIFMKMVYKDRVPVAENMLASAMPQDEDSAPEAAKVLHKPAKRKAQALDFFLIAFAVPCMVFVTMWLEAPAPFMVGSLFASFMVLTVRKCKLEVPQGFMVFAQACIGFAAARSIDMELLRMAGSLLLPLLVVTVVVIGGSLLLGLIMSKLTKWDALSCQLACAPGGLSQMILTAQELGADLGLVFVTQSIRLVSIIAIWPFIVAYIVA